MLLLYDLIILELKIMNISELDFSRIIVYEEDDIHSPSLNFIKQDEDVDMSFDVLITLKTYIKRTRCIKRLIKTWKICMKI
jgi:hypothetical protein